MADGFGRAAGLHLTKDADFEKYIDPSVKGADRKLALTLMKLMPANWRGDFVYVRRDGRVISNRVSVAAKVHFFKKPFAGAHGGKLEPSFTPPTDSSTGPYVRQYSQTGVSAIAGFATIGCQNSTLTPGDKGFMYGGVFDANGTNFDAGLQYTSDSQINAFVNRGGYYYSGWTNNSYNYTCGEHIDVFTGVININGQITGVLLTGIPDEDPTVNALPPSQVNLQPAAWDFFPLSGYGSFNNPGTWNGQPAPCVSCTAKRMTSIGFGAGNFYDNDYSCFGACSGTTTNDWDQVVMGQLIQPCSNTQGSSAECTLQYFTDGSWMGGLQQEPSAQAASSYSPSSYDYNQYQEGINLNPVYGPSGSKRVQSTGKWHVYATPTPRPRPSVTPPLKCGTHICY